jgi:hypothetical protein
MATATSVKVSIGMPARRSDGNCDSGCTRRLYQAGRSIREICSKGQGRAWLAAMQPTARQNPLIFSEITGFAAPSGGSAATISPTGRRWPGQSSRSPVASRPSHSWQLLGGLRRSRPRLVPVALPGRQVGQGTDAARGPEGVALDERRCEASPRDGAANPLSLLHVYLPHRGCICVGTSSSGHRGNHRFQSCRCRVGMTALSGAVSHNIQQGGVSWRRPQTRIRAWHRGLCCTP